MAKSPSVRRLNSKASMSALRKLRKELGGNDLKDHKKAEAKRKRDARRQIKEQGMTNAAKSN